MEPEVVMPENVWSYAQNKPSYVADDLARYGVPHAVTYAVLMARGVFKWLSVRRDLIRLKNYWRLELTRLQGIVGTLHGEERARTSERIKTLTECRGAIRALCHSERWRAPDHDGRAWRWLLSKGHLPHAPQSGLPRALVAMLRRHRDVAEPREVAP